MKHPTHTLLGRPKPASGALTGPSKLKMFKTGKHLHSLTVFQHGSQSKANIQDPNILKLTLHGVEIKKSIVIRYIYFPII